MCYDVFAAWSWLLPLNVSALTSLTPCEPPLRPLLRVGGSWGPGQPPPRRGSEPHGGHAGRGVGWETRGPCGDTETCGAHSLQGTGIYAC